MLILLQHLLRARPSAEHFSVEETKTQKRYLPKANRQGQSSNVGLPESVVYTRLGRVDAGGCLLLLIFRSTPAKLAISRLRFHRRVGYRPLSLPVKAISVCLSYVTCIYIQTYIYNYIVSTV